MHQARCVERKSLKNFSWMKWELGLFVDAVRPWNSPLEKWIEKGKSCENKKKKIEENMSVQEKNVKNKEKKIAW